MSTLRLMLVRHGQTAANLRRELDATPPGPPLTEEGHAQAAALAEELRTHPVSAVYASTATRAQQTANPVARGLGLDVRVLDGVHEVDVGSLQGRADAEAYKAYGEAYTSWLAGKLDARMPDGESGHEVYGRYLSAVDRIRETHPSGLVVLVSHGGVIRLVADILAGNLTDELTQAGLLPNTGRVLLESRGTGWHCAQWTGVL